MKNMLVLLMIALFTLSGCSGSVRETSSSPGGAETSTAMSSAEQSAQTSEEDASGQDIVAGYPAASPEEAVAYLTQFHPAVYGFAGNADHFSGVYIEEVSIHGGDCYKIRLEASYPEGNSESEDVFVRTDLGVVYMHNNETNTYFEITDFDYEGPQGYPGDDDEGSPQGYPSGSGEEAIEFLSRYSKEDLDLPAELDDYTVMVDGEMEVEGTACYMLGVYADLGARMELMGTYFVAFDNSVVFSIDPQSGGYVALPAR